MSLPPRQGGAGGQPEPHGNLHIKYILICVLRTVSYRRDITSHTKINPIEGTVGVARRGAGPPPPPPQFTALVPPGHTDPPVLLVPPRHLSLQTPPPNVPPVPPVTLLVPKGTHSLVPKVTPPPHPPCSPVPPQGLCTLTRSPWAAKPHPGTPFWHLHGPRATPAVGGRRQVPPAGAGPAALSHRFWPHASVSPRRGKGEPPAPTPSLATAP